MRRLTILVILALALSCWLVPSRQADAQAIAASSSSVAKAKFDVSYIPPSAVAVVAAYPRSVLMSKEMDLFPSEYLPLLSNNSGINPSEVERVLAIFDPPLGKQTQWVVILQMARPIDKEKVLPAITADTIPDKLNGQTYRKGKSASDLSVYVPDGRTVFCGTDELLRKVVANHAAPREGKLSAMLVNVGTPDIVAIVNVAPLRPIIDAKIAEQPPPQPLIGLAKMPDLTQYIAAKINLTGNLDMTLSIRANDEMAAEQIDSLIDGLMSLGKQTLMQQLASQESSDDPVQKATAQYIKRASDAICKMFRPVRKGATLTLAGSGRESFQRWATLATAVGLFAVRVPGPAVPPPQVQMAPAQPMPMPDNRVR